MPLEAAGAPSCAIANIGDAISTISAALLIIQSLRTISVLLICRAFDPS
jgi:hypothetical protein